MVKPKLMAVPTDLPDPPYPEDTKVRGWRFELDHERINQSDTWALASPDMRPWLLMTWHVSWQQIPAGSLPTDEELIAAKIGMEKRLFVAHRDILLRGWVIHSNNRLYHNVITSQVCEYLELKEKERVRKAEYRERMTNQRNVPRDSHGTPTGVRTPEPEPEPEPVKNISLVRFETWWNEYDKKRNRKGCVRVWKSKRLEAKAEILIEDTKKRLTQDRRWLEGYQPDPLTYLNQERWTDEIEPPKRAERTAGGPRSARQWQIWTRANGLGDGPAGFSEEQFVQWAQSKYREVSGE